MSASYTLHFTHLTIYAFIVLNKDGLGSSQPFPLKPTLNLPPVQISSKLSTERGITDKTVVITDRGRGRN